MEYNIEENNTLKEDIELELKEGPEEEIKSNVQEAIDKLLYNSIIEDYEVIYESKNVK